MRYQMYVVDARFPRHWHHSNKSERKNRTKKTISIDAVRSLIDFRFAPSSRHQLVGDNLAHVILVNGERESEIADVTVVVLDIREILVQLRV